MVNKLNQVVSEEVVTAIKEENKISEINLQKVLLEEFYGELNYPDDLDRLNLLTLFYEELKSKKTIDLSSITDIEYYHICIGMYEILPKMIKCVDKLLKKAKEENSPNKYFYMNYKNVLKKDLKRVREWMLCASQFYFKTIKF